jgi:hypothetical protein
LLTLTRGAATAVNDGVHLALDPILVLLKTNPTRSGDNITFGPVQIGNANYRFTMHRFSTSEQRFGWRLQSASMGSNTYTLVAGGTMRVGDTPRRGTGTLTVDGNAFAANDPSLHSKGTLLLGFVNSATTKLLAFSLDGFSSDTTVHPLMTGTATSFTQDRQTIAVRIATTANLAESPTPAPESLVIKLHWMKDSGARLDAIATNGDVPAGKTLLVSECVPVSLEASTTVTTVAACNASGLACTALAGRLPLSCPAGALDLPNADPTAKDPPAGIPAAPAVPSGVIDGTQG